MIQSTRFEYKFLVPEIIARHVGRELRPFMRLDPWLEKAGRTSYLVSSIYLDSANLHCYEAVEQGARNRFKLRIRWYGVEVSAPVFLEEKKRTNEAISKVRVPLDPEGVRAMLRGDAVPAAIFPGSRGPSSAAADLLLAKVSALAAVPSCIVRYEREAWESPVEKCLRVTFDRSLCAAPAREGDCTELETSLPAGMTILEIKFRDRVPEWLNSLVRRHGLSRRSVPKYVLCVDAMRDAGARVPELPGGWVLKSRGEGAA